MYKHTIQ